MAAAAAVAVVVVVVVGAVASVLFLGCLGCRDLDVVLLFLSDRLSLIRSSSSSVIGMSPSCSAPRRVFGMCLMSGCMFDRIR